MPLSIEDARSRARERRVIALIACVQFVNIVDFMMVMPMGPDFARALGISTNHVGIIGGSYTLAAAVIGLLLVPVLDRFHRRKALTLAIMGLGLATLLATQATGLHSLVFTRILAGIFGGAASSLALATIADAIPPQRRGRAMAWVMAAFSFASVAGVPIGLELSLRLGWQAPFAAVGILAMLVASLVASILPDVQERHEPTGERVSALESLVRNPAVLGGYAMVATAMFAGFLIIPNIATFLVFNFGFPRDQIGVLYMLGGAASFFVIQGAGRMIDRFGALPASVLGTVVLGTILVLGFVPEHPTISVYLLFVLFMAGMNIRFVTNQTVTSKIPAPHLRAGYLSLQSAIQHMATTLGAFVSSLMLGAGADGRLLHMPWVVALALGAIVFQPLMIWVLRRSPHAYDPIH